MPLASRSGHLSPVGLDKPIENKSISQEEIIDHSPYVEDTYVNMTSLNPETYAEEFKLLQRYSLGSRISVTYFLNSTPTAGLQRATAIDPSSLRSQDQKSYTEIKNFEIVIQGKGIRSDFNQESNETKVTGEALLYPGMKPRLGDLFITPIGDAVYGVFQVMNISRLTHRQGSNHRISFFLREYASDERISQIRESVTKTLFFDKEIYLGDTTTLLKSESYHALKVLRSSRTLLIRYYYNTFYSKELDSIMSPQGIYDPYLVHYLNSKISIVDSVKRPLQLYPGHQNYENSIWYRLTDVTNRTLVGLQSNYTVDKYKVSRWDVSITSLVNRTLITLENANRQAMEQSVNNLKAVLPIISPTGMVTNDNYTISIMPLKIEFKSPVYLESIVITSGSNTLVQGIDWTVGDVDTTLISKILNTDPTFTGTLITSINILSSLQLPYLITYSYQLYWPRIESIDYSSRRHSNRTQPSVSWSLIPILQGHGYVLSPNFYASDKTTMTMLEFLIYSVIKERKFIGIKDFIDGYLLRYTELTYDEQFYFIPLYLWLVDMAIDNISAPDAFMT